MTLAPHMRIGPYEITAKLGEGGMGEVYRATDSKLRREVAIKVLPPAFTEDRERLARFEREAQLLAQLHHPNIASIFGLEESGGTNALVMELVEGEDLSTILARGPLPLDDALAIARQIADALEAAHDQGIVHRDLKPANVKVRPDGTVKVLDFGLAKAAEQGIVSNASNPATSPTLMNSPTLTRAHATQLGVILGTAAYMAPEQARGRNVDRRADVWAFGVVLYEMLTGRRAFPGEDVSDVLATVLKIEPEWSVLPRDTPPAVRRLLRRSLEKDPRKRLSAIGDARLELDEHEAEPEPAAARPQPSWLFRLWPALAGTVIAAGIGALLWPHSGAKTPTEAIRTSILAPPGETFVADSTDVAISPDGRRVAFITGSTAPGANGALWVRRLDSLEAHRLTETGAAQLPFWSPDSRRIGFFSGSKLCTIAADGGRAEVLAESGNGRGGAWSPANVIVFAPEAIGPLLRVSSSGGAAVPATKLDVARGEVGHRMPTFLPDGVHFLFASLPATAGQFEISVGSLADGARIPLGRMESAPVYAAPGWLLLTRQGGLGAQRFDAAGGKLLGDAVSLVDQPTMILDPQISYTAGRPTSASTNGTLAYYASPSIDTKAVWLDGAGRVTGALDLPPGHYEKVVISPDGAHAVLERTVSGSVSSLWLVDHPSYNPGGREWRAGADATPRRSGRRTDRASCSRPIATAPRTSTSRRSATPRRSRSSIAPRCCSRIRSRGRPMAATSS